MYLSYFGLVVSLILWVWLYHCCHAYFDVRSITAQETGKLLWFLYLKNVFGIQLKRFSYVDSFKKRALQKVSVNYKGGVGMKNQEHARFVSTRAFTKRRLIMLLFMALILSGQFTPLHELVRYYVMLILCNVRQLLVI